MNKDRSREHGVIEEREMRTVGMDPKLAPLVVREEEDFRYPLQASSLVPPGVRVSVAAKPVGTLMNGLGANWSPLGQGAEAIPADDDEAGWAKALAGLTDTGIRWIRYWLPPMGVMAKGKVVASHTLFRQLERLQAWAEAANATLMLDLCKIPEEYRFTRIYDAPADNARYVKDYILPLILHVMKTLKCDRIRRLCLFNEPFNVDVAPFIFSPKPPKDPLLHYLELHEILRTALDKAGLKTLGLIGPNSANLFQRHLEMFEDKGLGPRLTKAFAELDVHSWRLRFDYYPPSKRWPGYGVTEGIERYLKPTLAAARRLGKGLSITEAGAMYFNGHPCSSRTTQHDAFLTMAEGVVRAVNEGITGAMIWAYTCSGKIDGQWGWIGTRERKFDPVPNLYNGFKCLMRHHRPGAAIHPCALMRSDFSPFISAGALFMGKAGETIWLINDHPVENITVRVTLPPKRSKKPWTVWRKDFAPEIKVLEPLPNTGTLELVLPGMSLTTLTTL